MFNVCNSVRQRYNNSVDTGTWQTFKVLFMVKMSPVSRQYERACVMQPIPSWPMRAAPDLSMLAHQLVITKKVHLFNYVALQPSPETLKKTSLMILCCWWTQHSSAHHTTYYTFISQNPTRSAMLAAQPLKSTVQILWMVVNCFNSNCITIHLVSELLQCHTTVV